MSFLAKFLNENQLGFLNKNELGELASSQAQCLGSYFVHYVSHKADATRKEFPVVSAQQCQATIDTWVKYQLDGTDGANKEKLIKAVLQPSKQLEEVLKEGFSRMARLTLRCISDPNILSQIGEECPPFRDLLNEIKEVDNLNDMASNEDQSGSKITELKIKMQKSASDQII